MKHIATVLILAAAVLGGASLGSYLGTRDTTVAQALESGRSCYEAVYDVTTRMQLCLAEAMLALDVPGVGWDREARKCEHDHRLDQGKPKAVLICDSRFLGQP